MTIGNYSYIHKLIEKDSRIDGRRLDEFRKPIKIELDISENAEGSARVKIGDTDVMVGVKMSVGEPFSDSPDKGILIVGAELLPLSSPEFESGPPDAQTTELARVVDRGIRESGMIEIEKLCIKEGELVWIVFLDIYSVNDDGNLIDAAALGSVLALQNTVFPKLENDKIVYGDKTKKKLPLKSITITCTCFKLNGKIFVDPNNKEEKASDARLTVAVSEDGSIHAMQKGGSVAINEEEIDSMIDLAVKKTKELRKIISEVK